MNHPLPTAAAELLSAGLTAAQLAEALNVPVPQATTWRDEYVAARLAARRRRRRAFAAGVGVATVLTLVVGRQAFSVGSCSQTLPFGLVTLCADEPAVASEVNGNFGLLASWLNDKVGPRTSATLTTSRIEGSTQLVVNTTSGAGMQLGGPLLVSGSVRLGDDSAACTAGSLGALRSRATGLERCNGASWAKVGPGGTELVSCLTLRTANPSLPDGHYVLKAAGYQFSADCDMARGGWTMIQAHAAAERTVEGLAVSSFGGISLPAAAVRALARAATQVRIDSPTGAVASSSNGSAIVALRGLMAMQENGSSWTLLSGTFDRNVLNVGCGTSQRYPDTYHACGNSGGLHISGDIHSLTNSTNSDINFWVR